MKINYLQILVFSGATLFGWQRSYRPNDGEINRGYCVQETFDGDYIITGDCDYDFFEGAGDVFLIKTNVEGDTLWLKTFGGDLPAAGNHVIQTPDSGFAVVGYTYSYGHG